jgi:hypothetical protein
MIPKLKYSLIVLLFASLTTAQQSSGEFPKLTGPYLGQKPPGDVPEIFGSGIVSLDTNFECCRAIPPDAKEFFFVRNTDIGEKIYRMFEESDGWTMPEQINYTDKAFQYTPFISPSGDKLLFMAGDSNPKRDNSSSMPEIWMLLRNGKDWGPPVLLGTTIGGAQPFYITMTRNGTLYFSCVDRNGIYKSEFKDGKYCTAERLPEEINYLERISHPYISPNEDFLIVDGRNNKTELYADLFISFRNEDGTWTKAVNMGDTINTPGHEVCPSVSPDGKYIFFGRAVQGKKTDIYWVSAKIIEELKSENNK